VERALGVELAKHGFSTLLARPITQLCTLHDGLPQGAPTSSDLLDIVLRPVDERLADVCGRHGAKYSRYVDDFTLSCGSAMRWAEAEVISALDLVSLRLRHEKTRRWEPSRHPIVTGIVLRDRPEFPREYIVRVKALIERASHETAHLPPEEILRLRSMLGQLRRLHPRLARTFEDQLRRSLEPV
jgi:hypothetical protein